MVTDASPSFGSVLPSPITNLCLNSFSTSSIAPITIQNIGSMVPIKLTTTNYLAWSVLFVPIFRRYNLTGIIDEYVAAPPKLLRDSSGNAILNPDYVAWYENDQNILIWINSTLSDSLIPYTVDVNSSRELWSKLESRLATASQSYVHELHSYLHTFTKGDSTATTYLQQIEKISDALASAGVPIEEPELLSVILPGLPFDYDSFVDAIQFYLGSTTIDELHGLLLSKEIQLANCKKSTASGSFQAFNSSLGSSVGILPLPPQIPNSQAFLAQNFLNFNQHHSRGQDRNFNRNFSNPRSNNQRQHYSNNYQRNNQMNNYSRNNRGGRFGSTFSRRRITCQICCQNNHEVAECPHRRNPHFGSKTSQSAMCANAASSSATPTWLLDSCASSHMTNSVANLQSSEPYTGSEQVYIGDGKGTKSAKLERHGDHLESQRVSQPGTFSSSSPWPAVDAHHNNHLIHHNHHQDSNHYDHHHHGNHSNGPFHPVPFSVRRRAWSQHNQGLSPDNIESALHVKLYVAQVSRIATEELIRPLFEQFGSVIEVVILRDKRTGHQQGTCFVKFATQHEADRAITALNNQHFFPGEAFPMTVKYADGELERLETLGKVYVNGLNKEASWKEVEDIFSPYGLVLDVYILRDELRQSRGCGFVKFSQIDMALAAIKALNGTFIMRGCAQPLLVRFADPKKPKGIDSRGNFGFSSGNIGPHSQEPFRLVSDHGDPMGGHNFHSAPYPVQQTSNPPIPQLANPEPLASIVMPPPQLCRMPLQQTQNTQRSSQTSQVEANETQKQHLTQPSGQIIGQQQSSQTVASNSTSPALASSHETAVPLECDWSEHTCPDGYKYYYNCETCESIWDKPEEFALFEKQLQTQTQTQPQNCSHHLQSTSVLSIQQSDQAQVEIQTHAFHQTLQLQKPSFSSTELDHLQIQPQTSPLVGPT